MVVIHECPVGVEGRGNGDNQQGVRLTTHAVENFAQNVHCLASKADIHVLIKHDEQPPGRQVTAVRTR